MAGFGMVLFGKSLALLTGYRTVDQHPAGVLLALVHLGPRGAVPEQDHISH